MRLIYWLDEVTSEAFGFVLVALLGGPLLLLEKLGLIKFEQHYQDVGIYDPATDSFIKPAE